MQIIVVGLGYVGLPLAIELAKYFDVVGLDIDERRVAELRSGADRTREVDADNLRSSNLRYASSAEQCPAADMYIVTVPTPIDDANQPDLRPVISATRTVASMIDPERSPVIVYESTVYPGVTDDICGPLIEEITGLKRGCDFTLGYSPERINPGDREHTVSRITKVIAGENPDVTERLATVYGAITTGGVFKATSIKAAEAAKVIENAQRDINIAFMNEITRIFARLDLSVWDVLDAANTKWNFLPFQPGLVGGHCIGVDPYYLSHCAETLGCDPQVILAGRSVNDGMGNWLANEIHARMNNVAGDVLVLGLTFKENVPDLRNSKVIDVINGLKTHGHTVTVHDPLADPAEAQHEYGVSLDANALSGSYDAVVALVPHDAFRTMTTANLTALTRAGGLIVDLKRMWRALAIDSSPIADRTYWAL